MAYGCNFSLQIDRGLLLFHVYRSADITKAFEKAGEIVRRLMPIDDRTEHVTAPLEKKQKRLDINSDKFLASKCALTYKLVSREDTMSNTASQRFLGEVFKNVPEDYSQRLINAIQETSEREALRSLATVLSKCFDPQQASTSIVLPSAWRAAHVKILTAEGLNIDNTRKTVDAFFK